MLRTSLIFAAVLSLMVLMQPVHGLQPLLAQQPAGGGRGGGGGQAGGPVSSIADRTANMQKIDGYFPIYWDERTGSMFLEIPRFDTEFLLNTGLAAGLGSSSSSRTSRSVRVARTRSSANRSKTRSRNRSCGDSPSRLKAAAACS